MCLYQRSWHFFTLWTRQIQKGHVQLCFKTAKQDATQEGAVRNTKAQWYFATAGAQAFVCLPPHSPLPFQNASELHKNCPETKPGAAPTHLWARGTRAPVRSGLGPQRWGCLKTGCNNQSGYTHPPGMRGTGKPPAVATDKRLYSFLSSSFFLNRKRFYDTQPKRSASRHGAT